MVENTVPSDYLGVFCESYGEVLSKKTKITKTQNDIKTIKNKLNKKEN